MNGPITPAELAEIRARADAATPAPWIKPADRSHVIAPRVPVEVARTGRGIYGAETYDSYGGELIGESMGTADALFVAAARVDVPRLVAEVERLQQWVADLQSGLWLNCVYCGHRYGPGEPTSALTAHIERCPAHPMSQLRADVERLTSLLERYRSESTS